MILVLVEAVKNSKNAMATNKQNQVKVGLGLLIFKEDKVLLGKRKGAHGAGEYAGTGGHFEYMESFEESLLRETREECGIDITNIRFLCLTNVKEYAPKHYVDIGFVADWKSGKPLVLEPDKLESWDWYDTDNLPKPLFGMLKNYFEALKTGKNYFDT